MSANCRVFEKFIRGVLITDYGTTTKPGEIRGERTKHVDERYLSVHTAVIDFLSTLHPNQVYGITEHDDGSYFSVYYTTDKPALQGKEEC